MNKKQLIAAISAQTEIDPTAVESVLNELPIVIATQLKGGGELKVPNIGNFKSQNRAPRVGRNPQTGQQIEIPAKTVVKFTASKALKDAVQ